MIKKYTFLLLPILLFIGCELGNENKRDTSDADLIQMIIDADKIDVDVEELPVQSILYVENIIEYDGIGARMASGLGYEVNLAGNGYRCGHRNEIYFDSDGRKLEMNDSYNKREWDNESYNRDSSGKDDWKCFELVFPVTYEMPDGSILTIISNDEEGWQDLKYWYEQNFDSDEKPLLQFPINIVLDEEIIVINNSDALIEVYRECVPEYDRNGYNKGRSDWECFELVFPVTYEMPDGSTLTVTADDEEGWSELKDWYEENNSFEEPLLQYPVDIIYEDEEGASTAVTINNSEEMREAKAECLEWDGEDSDWECFEIILPVTVIMPDGSIMIIEDEDEGWLAIRNWYEENDSDEEPFLQYPVDILYEGEEDDVIVTINSDEEWIEAEEECYGEFERP